MKRISLIFGTRPEAIKLSPLILALRGHPTLSPHVCVTGQHRQMLDQVLDVFGIQPDVDLALMRPSQTLGGLGADALGGIDACLGSAQPDLVVVQGDTTTAFIAALAAFYRRIPVAHVEAGLRTGDKSRPFPEETNRVLITRLADWHFAPTAWARDNLLNEGIKPNRIVVTGNTVIDALHIAVKRAKQHPPVIDGLPSNLTGDIVLVTGHRREHFGDGFEAICQAIAELADRFGAVQFVYPVHLNPSVREPVFRLLKGRGNVHLIEPLSYLAFVSMMERSRLILTDSGGVQEESPSLGKPVLLMRDVTERPEAVQAGTVRLVGASRERIVAEVARLLTDPTACAAMAHASNPYGDGRACERIVQTLQQAC